MHSKWMRRTLTSFGVVDGSAPWTIRDVKMAAIEENTPGGTPVHLCEIAPERHER
jgi:hypothetical protein